MLSAMMERSELLTQRKSTLRGFRLSVAANDPRLPAAVGAGNIDDCATRADGHDKVREFAARWRVDHD
jgi:hypothetical protein